MVRDAKERKRKYDHKVDPEVLAKQTKTLKTLMVEGQAKYFPDIVSVEEKVKKLVEAQGVYGIQVRDYINFGREMYFLAKKFMGTTLQAEAQLKVNKWSDRGLDGSLLVSIAGFFGVKPSAPPTPPIIVNLNDLADVEITTPSDGQLLTYEEATELWKNKDPPEIPEMIDRTIFQTDQMLRSAVTTDYFLLNGVLYGTAEAYFVCSMVAGTFKQIRVRVPVNSNLGTTTITLRRNWAGTALTVQIPAKKTGDFIATVDVGVNAGDLCSIQCVVTGSGALYFNVQTVFQLG